MIRVKEKNNLSKHRFIDLFSGIGSFRFALESFGAKCVFSSEIDRICQRTYEANHGERPCGDITKIGAQEIPDHDILCAGFPCQAFSISGKQKGFNDNRGKLFYHICRIAKEKKPQILILENVKNLEVHDSGRTLSIIKDELTSLGYSVSYKLLNSGHFGIPQARQRVFIFCILGDQKYVFPEPTMEQKYLKDVLVSDEESRGYVIDMRLFPNKIEKVVPEEKLSPIRIGYINSGRQGERIYHPNGLSITLSSGGGGIGAKTGMYLINDKVRRLTPRECARLTGIPDSFILHKSPSQSFKQFGNSLVIDVVQHIIMAAIKQDIFARKIKKDHLKKRL